MWHAGTSFFCAFRGSFFFYFCSINYLPGFPILEPDLVEKTSKFTACMVFPVAVDDASWKVLLKISFNLLSSWSSENRDCTLIFCEYDTTDTRELSGDILNLLKSVLAKSLARLKVSSSILAEASRIIAKSIFLLHISVFPVKKNTNFIQTLIPCHKKYSQSECGRAVLYHSITPNLSH